MKTTGGFKLWQIIYPIGIYYVVSSLMYFVLGLFLGDGQQTYMLRQLICSAATIPATMSFYKQDKIAEQVVYGTEKEKLDTKWLTDAVLAVVGAAALGIAVNNIIAMTPLVQMSEGFQEANQSFFAGTVVFELLGSCLVIPIAEELLFRGVVYKRLKLYFGVTPALIGSALIFGIMHVNLVQFLYAAVIGLLLAFVLEKTGKLSMAVFGHIAANLVAVLRTDGDRMAGVHFLSDGKRHFVYGCDGSGRNSRCQPFLPEKIIRYIKTTFHYIFHKKSL
mgnify:CR=1 FL=1